MRGEHRDWLKDKKPRGYIRESTVAQGKDDRFGPEIQKHAQQRAVEKLGLRALGDYYTDLVSGTNALKRSDFQRMVTDARAKRFDVLLAYDVSRFARNETDAWVYLDALRDIGVPVYFCDEDILTIHDEDWRDQIGQHINAAAAYSRKLARNVRRGYERKWDRGGTSGGWAAFGYRRSADKRSLELNEDAPTRALIFERYATGAYSFLSLSDELNSQGLRIRGKPFKSFTVDEILHNPIAIGTLRRDTKGETVTREDAVTPIVSRQLWDKVQALIDERAERPKPTRTHQYVFSGVARCADCGEGFQGGQYITYPSRRWHARIRHAPRGCRKGTFSEHVLLRIFGEWFRQWRLGAEAKTRVARYIRDHASTNQVAGIRRQQLEGELGRIRDLYRWGDMAEDQYLADRRRLSRALEALPTSTAAEPPAEAFKLLAKIGDVWERSDLGLQRRFVDEWFDHVRLARNGDIEVRVREQYRPLVFEAAAACAVAQGSSDPARRDRTPRVEGLAEWLAWAREEASA